MTLDKLFTEAVQKWHGLNGDQECTAMNGRGPLLALYESIYRDKSRRQANRALTDYLRRIRTVIRPEFTPKAFTQKSVGAPTSVSVEEKALANAFWNPIWNPINSPIWNPINSQVSEIIISESHFESYKQPIKRAGEKE